MASSQSGSARRKAAVEVLPNVPDRLSGRQCADGVDQEVAFGGRRGVGPRRAVDVTQDPEINQVFHASE